MPMLGDRRDGVPDIPHAVAHLLMMPADPGSGLAPRRRYADGMSTAARPRRRPVLAVLDVAVGAVALLFGLVLGLYALGTYFVFSSPRCSGCDTGPLAVYVIVGIGLTVLIYGLGLGFFVVRMIQRRYGWYFPVAALVLLYAVFFVIAALVGAWYKGVSS